jgi:hypothetical protein
MDLHKAFMNVFEEHADYLTLYRKGSFRYPDPLQVTTLGPEGPSVRLRGRLFLLPAGSPARSRATPGNPPVTPMASIFLAALMSASKSDPQLVQTKRERLMRLAASTA